jgi:DNA-directed RNA polymerase specialized sigma24 family protein
MAKKNKEHYVNREEFENELRDYYETDVMNDALCIKLQKIATGLSFAPSFVNYSYRDDMVGDAMIKMYTALRDKKFRFAEGSSPFSYFTTIAYNEFVSRIKREKRHHDVVSSYKQRVYEEYMTDPEMAGYIYVKPSDDDNEY